VSVAVFDAVRRIVQEELARLRTAELGIVTEQHPHESDSDSENYSCSVELRNSGIVLRRVPVATSRIGMVSIPAVGDLVLVQFIAGSVDSPVIVGSLYNNQDRPPPNKDGQAILHLPPGAADSSAARLELSTADGPVLVVRMGSTVVTIQDDDPAVTIDVGGNAGLEIGSNGAIKVQSGANIEMKGSGNIDIEASGTLTLKGATVNIN
jgi:phage baseplate assembly protein gpV